MKLYILTGAPSAGKSTIIHDLKSKNYDVVHEAATDVIKAEHENGNWEPWTQKQAFINKVVDLQKQRQQQALSTNFNIVFFDRSPICTFALCLFLKLKPPPNLTCEIDRVVKNKIYQNKVFFIENLGFCERNEIRKISFEQCLEFEEIHKKLYKKYGYELILIPKNSVVNRVKNIIQYL